MASMDRDKLSDELKEIYLKLVDKAQQIRDENPNTRLGIIIGVAISDDKKIAGFTDTVGHAEILFYLKQKISEREILSTAKG